MLPVFQIIQLFQLFIVSIFSSTIICMHFGSVIQNSVRRN